jgi:hypothetical protein
VDAVVVVFPQRDADPMPYSRRPVVWRDLAGRRLDRDASGGDSMRQIGLVVQAGR